MTVLPFPSPVMTHEDEAVIIARATSVGYRCRSTLDGRGHRAILLLDHLGRIRGRVNKVHGVFTLSDAHDHPLTTSRARADVLAALEP